MLLISGAEGSLLGQKNTSSPVWGLPPLGKAAQFTRSSAINIQKGGVQQPHPTNLHNFIKQQSFEECIRRTSRDVLHLREQRCGLILRPNGGEIQNHIKQDTEVGRGVLVSPPIHFAPLRSETISPLDGLPRQGRDIRTRKDLSREKLAQTMERLHIRIPPQDLQTSNSFEESLPHLKRSKRLISGIEVKEDISCRVPRASRGIKSAIPKNSSQCVCRSPTDKENNSAFQPAMEVKRNQPERSSSIIAFQLSNF